MIILNTTESENIWRFPIIPEYEINSATGEDSMYLSFQNKTTKESFISSCKKDPINDVLYLYEMDLNFLKENTFYEMEVRFNATDYCIYKDNVFCTNQSPLSYSINNGIFVTPSIDNNSYITI